MTFLPISKKDIEKQGWDNPDFIFVSGDAYVDHPSFGVAIITRLLESYGYKVGVIAQPNWHNTDDIQKLGKPNIAFLVSSGNMDSMVNHYTSEKLPRSNDLYSPCGEKGHRPNRALKVYCNLIRQVYKDIPIIIGGIEGSLRRFSDYDYWDNLIHKSILLDTKADLLVYGMGEQPLIDIVKQLQKNIPITKMRNIRGTAYFCTKDQLPKEVATMIDNGEKKLIFPKKHKHFNRGIAILYSHDEICNSKKVYAKNFKMIYDEQDPIRGGTLVQEYQEGFVIQNPTALPLDPDTMDMVYNLPYERKWHPTYNKAGGVPAYNEVKYSITSHRGCFGGCNFCALHYHQGRIIQKRSKESIYKEVDLLIKDPDFKGNIHDIGGPSANFREPACDKQLTKGTCKDRQCLFPSPCPNLKVDYSEYLEILNHVRKMDKIKNVFIRSGIRYDHLLIDKSEKLFTNICKYHVSGQLKVAPEHIDKQVLTLMGKPPINIYQQFKKRYYEISKALGKEQYLVPYLISSHPGSNLNSAINLAMYLKKNNIHPEQVQNFYPTPCTMSTAMYYSGYNPIDMQKVYIPAGKENRSMQRALLQWNSPKNYDIIKDALYKEKRQDLIGYGENSLILPSKKPIVKEKQTNNKGLKKSKNSKKAQP